MHVDGNAAAGLLYEVFGREMTMALGTCGHCGASGALARTLAYLDGPGAVLRCPACSAVVLRVVRLPQRTLLDTGGLARLELIPG